VTARRRQITFSAEVAPIVPLAALGHLGEEFARAKIGAQPDFGRVVDQLAVFWLTWCSCKVAATAE